MATTMLPVALPRFAPSGSNVQSTQSSNQPTNGVGSSTPAWVSDGGDQLDFDLLAEYLLDDTNASSAEASSAAMPLFDFSVESAPPSGVVSPEQSEDGMFVDGPSKTKIAELPSTVTKLPPPPSGHAPVQSLATPATALARATALPNANALPPAPVVPPPRTASTPAPLPMPPQPAGVQQVQATVMVGASHPAPVPRARITLAPGARSAPAAHQYPQQAQVMVHQHGIPVTASGVTVTRVAAQLPNNKRQRIVGGPVGGPIPAPVVMTVPHGAIVNGHMVQPPMIPGSGRQKTQAQIDRRRERNRILARRTRLRKKFFFESLQKEVMDLQRENLALKELARQKLKPEASKALLQECNAMEKLPSAVQEACGEGMESLDSRDFNLVRSVQRSQQCFVISDPSLQDNPIVYASDDFLTLTGYKREEVLGRNCRFLQGTETSPSKVEKIRKGVMAGEDVSVTLINYTADGTAFWNKVFIAALRDAHNNIVNFIGVIVKVAAPDPDDPEAGKKLPGEVAETNEDGSTSSAPATAVMAEGAVKAIEGAVTAAVAAAPEVNGTSRQQQHHQQQQHNLQPKA